MRVSRGWALVAHAIFGLIGFPSLAPAQSDNPNAAVKSIVRDYQARHPEEIQKIVKDYIAKNPEAIHPAILDFIAKRAAGANSASAPDRAAAIKSNANALFNSPHRVTLGNPKGSVTMVEFFDYNCGFCKRALPDMLTLIKDHPNLRFVLREFPVLGPGSTEAARVAVAVRMQVETPDRYLEFPQKM